MKDFIKEFKRDIIFYGKEHYTVCVRETNVDSIYRQESLICECEKIFYSCEEFRDDTKYLASGIVLNDVDIFLKKPVSEIESLCNQIYYYCGLYEVEI